jgi:NitT/TauT family transport system ATP-binding protein
MKPLLHIQGLTKIYNGVPVVDQVDLDVDEGAFVCIVGPSGCGKTTLLNLIGGFLPKDEGSLTFDDRPVVRPFKEAIMVFQEFDQLFPWRTLEENVELPLKETVKDKLQRSKHAQQYIQMMKLEGVEHQYPNTLSGGMKQRGAIARALVTSPRMLLMDEPFGSLDAQTKQALQQSFLEVWKQTGTTVLFVTHDVREALIMADRIVVMTRGKIQKIFENKKKEATEEAVTAITEALSL